MGSNPSQASTRGCQISFNLVSVVSQRLAHFWDATLGDDYTAAH